MRTAGRQTGKLREFTAQLAQRLQAAAGQTSDTQRLMVRIGSDDYLVPLPQAGEVAPLPSITPVPWTRPWFRGLANIRGRLVGVVDLRHYAGGAPLAAAEGAQLLVLGAALPLNVALLITRAAGLRDWKELQAAAVADGPAWCRQRWIDNNRHELIELDLAALAADEDFGAIGV
jgi:twitching motility protein PilI